MVIVVIRKMNRYNILLLLVTLAVLMSSHQTSALNILAIVSLPLRTHYLAFQRIFEELALRGHSVTVMNNFPQDKLKNMSFVNMTINRPLRRPLPPLSDFDLLDRRYSHIWSSCLNMLFSSGAVEDDCRNFFTNENVLSFRQKNEKFDVIFVEQFTSDCGLAYAAVMYDAPIIGITSHTLLPWTYNRLSIPFNFGSDPFYYSPAGANPSWYNKIENYIVHNVLVYAGQWFIQRNLYNVFNKYLPDNDLDVERVSKERMKMLFVYQHHSVTGSRIATPQLLEIGGAHIYKAKPVTKEIEDFLSDAKDGAIFVSFGSNLKFNTMSKGKLQQFFEAFKKIPQKIIWKLENVTLPSGSDNIYAHTWLPQLDILCHPKVIGFVSHGGMLSLSEAAHCGKPLIMIPFFGDQFSNAAAAADSGIGIMMYFQNLDADSLVAAVRKIASPEMQQSAQRISKLWHDRPMDVIDSAIYWTEYVARHKDAPRPLPSTRSSWFQQSLIDVYIVLSGILLAISLVVYIIIKVIITLLKFVFRKNKQKSE